MSRAGPRPLYVLDLASWTRGIRKGGPEADIGAWHSLLLVGDERHGVTQCIEDGIQPER